MSDNTKMPITGKGLRMLLMGLVVMVAGFVLMMGGGTVEPDNFNWAMFDFRRLVAAPLVIICGIVIEIVAIMRRPKNTENE
ncbi:MAG: DUF3098 domain-containing protein [Alistipes sp.]|jgi:hypothetical protein|nr:DUF3098 domain-containing protein [Alistipes sp.]MDO4843351.1 DUF3098 domain-containing protein [Bacteroidales bacterium]MDY3833780.1 DUF3098 domain-containing protein [Candidatus Cryptobacteroides sp.]CDD19884.1 putative uncharacterized protein [Alistipes sp. CAG:435]MDD7710978.1 DUF3098 domain-containing protein [Alistipes sp.]